MHAHLGEEGRGGGEGRGGARAVVSRCMPKGGGDARAVVSRCMQKHDGDARAVVSTGRRGTRTSAAPRLSGQWLLTSQTRPSEMPSAASPKAAKSRERGASACPSEPVRIPVHDSRRERSNEFPERG
jgi:hypothetical protein